MSDLSHDEFEELVADVYRGLPEKFRKVTDGVLVLVEDTASDDVLADLEVEDPLELLGLYQGVDVTQKGATDASPLPDMVFLYRLPILAYWQDVDDDLLDIIRHVLVHEIGHHFGFSDEDMHDIEEG